MSRDHLRDVVGDPCAAEEPKHPVCNAGRPLSADICAKGRGVVSVLRWLATQNSVPEPSKPSDGDEVGVAVAAPPSQRLSVVEYWFSIRKS